MQLGKDNIWWRQSDTAQTFNLVQKEEGLEAAKDGGRGEQQAAKRIQTTGRTGLDKIEKIALPQGKGTILYNYLFCSLAYLCDIVREGEQVSSVEGMKGQSVDVGEPRPPMRQQRPSPCSQLFSSSYWHSKSVMFHNKTTLTTVDSSYSISCLKSSMSLNVKSWQDTT